MAYVVYEVESTRIVVERRFGTEYHATQAAAKRARTRMINKGRYKAEELKVQELLAYRLIEKKVQVKNLMTDELVYESVNTPNYLSVGSESYWSA